VTLRPYGSLRTFMDNYMQLLDQVAVTCGDDMVVRRWRPINLVDLPAIYNWMPQALFEQRDLSRWRDIPTIFTRVGIGGTDVETRMERLEDYADIFREIVDPAFDQPQPLNGSCYKVFRTGMSTVADTFNEARTVLAIQFPITVWLDRHIHA